MDGQKREITQAVGNRIRYFRRMQSISQEELALRAGLNPAYFGQVERGLKCPTIDTLYRIARALDVSLPELLRLDTPAGYATDRGQRVNELLARVPPDKLDQVLKTVEDIVDLF